MLVGSKPSKRLVISLVAFSGVGKTTLASVVYQSKAVQQHTDCHAWINVSHPYCLKDLLSCVAKMICPHEDFEEEEIDMKPETLYQILSMRRYVIVFDGAWHPDVFRFMNDLMPDNNIGSRIIITTNDNAIAAYSDVVLTLQPLPEKRAMELFGKSASISNYVLYVLKELFFGTVTRRHGLPLVIWAMDGILTRKQYLGKSEKIVSEWKVLLENLEYEIGEYPSHIKEVSRNFYHNYDNLSFCGRLCLLYFGVFPKDYLIPDVKLVKLWISEGFVKRRDGQDIGASCRNILKSPLSPFPSPSTR